MFRRNTSKYKERRGVPPLDLPACNMESSRGFLPCLANPVFIIKPRFALGQLLISCIGVAHFTELSYLRLCRIFAIDNSASCIATEAFYRLAINIIGTDYLVSFHLLTSFQLRAGLSPRFITLSPQNQSRHRFVLYRTERNHHNFQCRRLTAHTFSCCWAGCRCRLERPCD